MVYGGFWRRFGAMWLDVIVLLPLLGFVLWASSYSRLFYLYYFLPGTIFNLFYHVYLVRRYGGTPGKLLADLRICKVNGAPVGYREALLRFLPDVLLGALASVAMISASLAMTDSQYLSLGFLERGQRLRALSPSWYDAANIAAQVWVWSEFVVMMTNSKRRALHDFLAGTVVIVNSPNQSFEGPPDEPVTPFAEQPARHSLRAAQLRR